jgi:hypothetical protein
MSRNADYGTGVTSSVEPGVEESALADVRSLFQAEMLIHHEFDGLQDPLWQLTKDVYVVAWSDDVT